MDITATDNKHRNLYRSFGVSVLLFLLLAAPMQAQIAKSTNRGKILQGAVHDNTGHPVIGLKVGIHNYGDSCQTDDKGDFEIPLSPAATYGFIITLYVIDNAHHKDWRIIEPIYNGIPGQTPLPAPKQPSIIIKVAEAGDKQALLSDRSIAAMLLGATARFRKLSDLQQQALFKKGQGTIDVNYSAGHNPDRSLTSKYFDWWLTETAKSLGLSSRELESAIGEWTRKPHSDRDQALGLLYRGNLEAAASTFKKLTYEPNQRSSASQALAFTYVLSENYSAAEDVLRSAFSATDKLDPNLLFHLGQVFRLDHKPEEADRVFVEANALLRANGFALPPPPSRPTAVPTPNPTPLRTPEASTPESGCVMISPGVQRCDVGIPFGAATQKAKQQHMSEWCWAASISMAFAHHGYDVAQERIVAEAWGEIVNVPGSPEAILGSVNRRWKADDGRFFDVIGTPYHVSIPAVVQDLHANYPVLIGTMGHMMVLTHIAWIQNAYGQWQIVDATVRDPWPFNPSRRTLSAVEWANTQIAVRIRTRAVSSNGDDDDQ